MLVARIPRLFADVTESVMSDTTPDPLILAELRSRARRLRNKHTAWLSNYLDRNLKPFGEGSQNFGYCNVIVLSFHCRILINRILTALIWSNNSEAAAVEDETCQFARILHYTAGHSAPVFSNLQGALFMGHKIRLAEVTMSTTVDWKPTSGEYWIKRNLIGKEAFQHWCSLFGRSTESRRLATYGSGQ